MPPKTETVAEWRARTGRAPTYRGIDGQERTPAEHGQDLKAGKIKAPPPKRTTDPAASDAEDRATFAQQYEHRERIGAPVPQAGTATLTAALEMRRLRTGENLAQALDALGHVLACYAAGLDAPPPRLWSRRAIERADRAEAIQAAEARARAAQEAADAAARTAAAARADLAAAADPRKARADQNADAARRYLDGSMRFADAAAAATSRASFARAVREMRLEPC